jgi:hypothetical protein
VALTASSHDPASAEIKALYADLFERASFAFTVTVDGRILCPPRHDDRHAAHRHRSDSGTARCRPCPGCPRRQSRGTARADRGQTSAPAATLFPSGHSEDCHAIRPRHGRTTVRASPFPPLGPLAGFAGRGRRSLRTARSGGRCNIRRAALRTL